MLSPGLGYCLSTQLWLVRFCFILRCTRIPPSHVPNWERIVAWNPDEGKPELHTEEILNLLSEGIFASTLKWARQFVVFLSIIKWET